MQTELTEALKPKWEKLRFESGQEAPFYAYDWHKIWFTALATEWRPYIIYIDRRALAPLARRGGEVIFSGGREGTDYMDVIGQRNDVVQLWPDIHKYLQGDGAKTLKLINIPSNSPTVQYFSSKGGDIKIEDTTPVVNLPGTWEAYQNQLSRKNRHELKRKLRKFEREHPEAKVISIDQSQQQAEILLRLMRLDPEKRIFLRSEIEQFFRSIILAFTKQIWFLALSEKNFEIAATMAFTTKNEIMLYNSGFDESNAPGAGFYLKAKCLALAVEKAYEKFNFLRGRERYKYELGGVDEPVYSISYRF